MKRGPAIAMLVLIVLVPIVTFGVVAFLFSGNPTAAWMVVLSFFVSGPPDEPPTSDTSATRMYQEVFQQPVPSSVSRLQGRTVPPPDEYHFLLRFHASDQWIDALPSRGYQPAHHDDPELFTWWFGGSTFQPPWRPEKVKNPDYYEKQHVQNAWTSDGTHHLLIDRSAGIVHFYATE